MKKIEIEKLSDNNFKFSIESFLTIVFSQEEMESLGKKINDIIEENIKKNFSYIRNRKTGRLEKKFE